MDAGYHALRSHFDPAVTLTGTADIGYAGPPIGQVEIYEDSNSYFFRVVLTGARKDPGTLKCEIERKGKVNIQGVMSNWGFLGNSSTQYQTVVQQVSEPGPFTVSFNLPGPVDPRLCSLKFGNEDMLEVIVEKYKFPNNIPENAASKNLPNPSIEEGGVPFFKFL